MDEAVVAERGGFRTRAELMREAVENMLNELEFPEAPAEPAEVASAATAPLEDPLTKVPTWEREELTLGDLAGTALAIRGSQRACVVGGAAETVDEPLLGLHNRDYVSIWALSRLARYTERGPIGFDEYLDRVTQAAWYFGAQLQRLEERDLGRKLTVLFPTNTSKRPSAERGFQGFAVGGLGRRSSDGQMQASGPLFSWKAIDVTRGARPTAGLTASGWTLLAELEGLSLDLPHPPELAVRFLAHIAAHAPADRWGFDHLLRIASEGPDRERLVDSYHASRPDWTGATASSVAQGYVARAREWGLLEPKLVESRYWLTSAGRTLAGDLD